MRAVILICMLLGLLAPARAQARSPQGAGPSLHAYLDSGVVKLGDNVKLVVTVANAEDVRMRDVAAVAGLSIGRPQGPRINRSESWINGRRTSSVEHTFVVVIQPTGIGEFVIPSVDVTADGRELTTPELTLTVVEDLRGAELGLFELRASSPRVVEGQPFSLELVFGFDAALGQRVNYVNLSLPWWDQLSGALELESAPPPSNGPEFELNSRERVRVERLPNRAVGGRDFVMFRLLRSFLPTRTGALVFPTSFVEFGEVDERRDFFRTQRVKVETWYVRADDLSVEVQALPEKGRPLEFGGALGNISAEAQAEPRDVDAGDSIKLTVEWTGSGNLEFFGPPDLARLETFRNFRVYGMTDEVKSLDRRRVTYDIAPLTSAVTEIPSVPLHVYDPALGQYSTVETRPLAVRVRALENPSGLSTDGSGEQFERDVRNIVLQAAPAASRGGPGGGVVAGMLAVTPLLWLGLRVFARRGRDPDAPLERRRRRARRVLGRALRSAAGPKEQLDALNAFLAARCREADQAWLGRDAARLLELGLTPESARALSELVADLERGAYGGGTSADQERILQVTGQLIEGGL